MNDYQDLSKRKLFVISIGLIFLVALLLWGTLTSHSVTEFNDKLFLTSISFSCLGFVLSIIAKSRHHYYVHLQKTFSGKEIDQHTFDDEEQRRHSLSRIGLAIGASGIVGITLCSLMLLVG